MIQALDSLRLPNCSSPPTNVLTRDHSNCCVTNSTPATTINITATATTSIITVKATSDYGHSAVTHLPHYSIISTVITATTLPSSPSFHHMGTAAITILLTSVSPSLSTPTLLRITIITVATTIDLGQAEHNSEDLAWLPLCSVSTAFLQVNGSPIYLHLGDERSRLKSPQLSHGWRWLRAQAYSRACGLSSSILSSSLLMGPRRGLQSPGESLVLPPRSFPH